MRGFMYKCMHFRTWQMYIRDFTQSIIIQGYNFYLRNGSLPAGSEMDIKSNSRFIKIKIKTKRKRIRTKLYR